MHSDLGWLNSHHSFSFGGHYDPERMGFGPLQVVNDDIQYMSAGSGVVHSEYNPSKEKPVHFMQIWIEPKAKGLELLTGIARCRRLPT